MFLKLMISNISYYLSTDHGEIRFWNAMLCISNSSIGWKQHKFHVCGCTDDGEQDLSVHFVSFFFLIFFAFIAKVGLDINTNSPENPHKMFLKPSPLLHTWLLVFYWDNGCDYYALNSRYFAYICVHKLKKTKCWSSNFCLTFMLAHIKREIEKQKSLSNKKKAKDKLFRNVGLDLRAMSRLH